jgi:hypothetical protein
VKIISNQDNSGTKLIELVIFRDAIERCFSYFDKFMDEIDCG